MQKLLTAVVKLTLSVEINNFILQKKIMEVNIPHSLGKSESIERVKTF